MVHNYQEAEDQADIAWSVLIKLASASESDGWEAYKFPLVTWPQSSTELDVFTSK